MIALIMDNKGGQDCLKLKRGGSLPVLYARGTHYEVGYQVGRVFKSLIQDYVERDGFLQKTLVPYYNTKDGNRVFQRYLYTSETVYPQYLEELRGIADGANLDFIQLFLLHLEPEMSVRLAVNNPQDGCTAVLVNTQEAQIMAHSEDANPVMQNFCYILQITIVSEKSGDEVENFTAFAYPGCLPGNAFGFNVHGLVFTANYVPQLCVTDIAIPRRVYNRALLGVKSETELSALFNQNPGDAIKIQWCKYSYKAAPFIVIRPEQWGIPVLLGIGSGFNFNITWLPPCTEEQEKPIRMFSVELASSENGASTAEKTINSGFNFHFNVYQDLKVPNSPCRSSERRQKRVGELLHHRDVITKEKILSAVCDIMSDVTDKDFPLFRDGREPDNLATMAVAIIDLNEETLDVYVDRPNATKPIVTFSLRAGQNL